MKLKMEIRELFNNQATRCAKRTLVNGGNFCGARIKWIYLHNSFVFGCASIKIQCDRCENQFVCRRFTDFVFRFVFCFDFIHSIFFKNFKLISSIWFVSWHFRFNSNESNNIDSIRCKFEREKAIIVAITYIYNSLYLSKLFIKL